MSACCRLLLRCTWGLASQPQVRDQAKVKQAELEPAKADQAKMQHPDKLGQAKKQEPAKPFQAMQADLVQAMQEEAQVEQTMQEESKDPVVEEGDQVEEDCSTCCLVTTTESARQNSMMCQLLCLYDLGSWQLLYVIHYASRVVCLTNLGNVVL